MELNEYQQLCRRTVAAKPNVNAVPADSLHAVLGLADEVGEMAKILKACIFYGAPWDAAVKLHFMEECGDVGWFNNLAASSIFWSMSNVAKKNIQKLAVRYPEKFDAVKARIRDIDAELAALNS